MANPLLLDIVSFLTSQGIARGDGIDAFRDTIPDKPDALVALYEYAGSPQLPYESLVNRSVQVLVRDFDADMARVRALNIFNALKSSTAFVQFTPQRWGQVHLRQTPFKLRVDENDRVVYCFNMGVTTTID